MAGMSAIEAGRLAAVLKEWSFVVGEASYLGVSKSISRC